MKKIENSIQQKTLSTFASAYYKAVKRGMKKGEATGKEMGILLGMRKSILSLTLKSFPMMPSASDSEISELFGMPEVFVKMLRYLDNVTL